MKELILAIDFDGTIVEEIYPQIGPLIPFAKQVINELHRDGHHIIIWTCRKNEEVKQFLVVNQIHYHSINESHPDTFSKYGYESRKVGADIYVDDRSVSGLPDWLTIMEIIKKKAIKND